MDDNTGKTSPSPIRKKKRRLWKVLVGLALVAVGLVAIAPWILSTPPARAFLLGQVNAKLAPGSVELTGLGLSWTGPIELTGLSLRDPKGKVVLASRRLTLDRGLLGLLASRPDYGTITIEGATIDVERLDDGSIDVLQALASVVKTNPTPAPSPAIVVPQDPAPVPDPPSKLAVSVVIKGGTLRVLSPELVEPVTAGSLDGSITISPGKPIELTATLADEGRSLEIHSSLDPNASPDLPSDQGMSLVGKSWPIHVRKNGVEARGRFEGNLAAHREKGLWTLSGDASIVGVEATGPALQGDRLVLDKVSASCDAQQSATGWTIRKLDLTSPVGMLRGEGMVPAIEGTPAKLQGQVDLASLAKMLPNAMRLRDGLTLERGNATIKLDLNTIDGLERFELVASLENFAANEANRPVVLRQPAILTARAVRSKAKVSVETIEIQAAGVDVKASGDLEAGVKLSGTVDLAALNAQIRDVLDLGAFELSGQARMAADYRRSGETYLGRMVADCRGLKVAGVTDEPIVRDLIQLSGSARGTTRLDGTPIDWQEAKLALKSADLTANLTGTSKDGAIGLVGNLAMDVASPVPGRFGAIARFQHQGSVFAFDELRAAVTPADPKAGAFGVVALAVHGKLDLASGEGDFEPIAGTGVSAIGLGPQGAKLSGLGRSDLPLKIEANLVGDLAALDRLLASWSGSPPKGLAGAWSGRATVGRSTLGKLDVDARVDVPDITASKLKGPVGLAIQGGYSPDLDRLDLSTLALSTSYGRVNVNGRLLETKGRKLMELTATVEPIWEAIDPIIAASVDRDARFRGTFRTIKLGGMLQANSTPDLLGQMGGEVTIDLTMAEAFGVNLKPVAVVLKIGGGQANFEPIVTTLNDGPMIIQSRLIFDNDYGLWLRLDPCRVDDAVINEAVSNSVLAFAAPVLAKSSSVSGKTTVVINKGMVPITGTGPMSLDGAMAFKNVVFKPGPIANELTTITGQAAPDLKLDQTMTFKVADGRVTQSGLNIPIGGNGLRVAIDGSVGFDETLDLKATSRLSARALGLDANLDKELGAATVSVPIRGTLSKPAVDRKALTIALKNAARVVGEKQLKSEAGRFLERIASPKSEKDPR
jgi:translocation and assembly module TamB